MRFLAAAVVYVWEALRDGWGLTFGDRQATIARIRAERQRTDYRI